MPFPFTALIFDNTVLILPSENIKKYRSEHIKKTKRKKPTTREHDTQTNKQKNK